MKWVRSPNPRSRRIRAAAVRSNGSVALVAPSRFGPLVSQRALIESTKRGLYEAHTDVVQELLLHTSCSHLCATQCVLCAVHIQHEYE